MTSSRPPGATSWAVRAMAACRAALVSTCSEYLDYEVECAGSKASVATAGRRSGTPHWNAGSRRALATVVGDTSKATVVKPSDAIWP